MTAGGAARTAVAMTPCGAGESLEARLARLERERLGTRRPAGAVVGMQSSVDRTAAELNTAVSQRFSRSAALALADESTSAAGGTDWSRAFQLDDLGEAPTTQREASVSLAGGSGERIAALAPLPDFWSTAKRDVKELPHDIWRDTKRVYGNPVNLVILGTTYGASLALQETGPDDTVEDHYRGYDRTFNSTWSDAFGAIGNPGTHFALAGGWYLLGQQTGDTKTYEVGKTMFSALLINGVTVMAGQAASGDKAPNGEWGTFPSGHTSSSFVMASVLHEAYGHAVGIPLYGVAVLAGVQRLDSGEHYLSDVVMGGVMGTVIGHAVASGRDPEFFGWKVVPYVSADGTASGIGLMKTK